MFHQQQLGWILALSLGVSVQAQAYVGSVSSGTGEAGIASVEASESPFGNPAGLAHMKGYYFTAGFGATKQNKMGTNQDLAVSITDSMKDTIVPTSFSYVQNNYLPEGLSEDILSRSFKLSFGNMMAKQVAFGLAVAYDDDRLPDEHYKQTNVQAGFLWTPNQNIGAALVFDNLIEASDSVPEAVRQQQTIGTGVAFNFRRVIRFKADVLSGAGNTFAKPTVSAGIENYLNRWFILRIGAQRNNYLEANLYTAGLGFMGPKFALNYAYGSSPQNESLSRHSVDLALPIW